MEGGFWKWKLWQCSHPSMVLLSNNVKTHLTDTTVVCTPKTLGEGFQSQLSYLSMGEGFQSQLSHLSKERV